MHFFVKRLHSLRNLDLLANCVPEKFAFVRKYFAFSEKFAVFTNILRSLRNLDLLANFVPQEVCNGSQILCVSRENLHLSTNILCSPRNLQNFCK